MRRPRCPPPASGIHTQANPPRPVRTGEQLAAQSSEDLVEILLSSRSCSIVSPPPGLPVVGMSGFSMFRAENKGGEDMKRRHCLVFSASLLVSGVAGIAGAAGPIGRYYVTDESGF